MAIVKEGVYAEKQALEVLFALAVALSFAGVTRKCHLTAPLKFKPRRKHFLIRKIVDHFP